MTMHLLPVYYTSLNTKKRKAKKKAKVVSQHDIWLLKNGLHPDQIKQKKTVDKKWKQDYIDTMRVDRGDYVSSGLSEIGRAHV